MKSSFSISRIVPLAATAVLLFAGSAHAQTRKTPTYDGSDSMSANSSTLTLTFDASGSDKLVVVVTGEHGFNNTSGQCTGITYDGVALTNAVDRNPLVSGSDILYNDIWYLDDPGSAHSAGVIEASVSSRGSMTAIGLSDTAPDFSATVIEDQPSTNASLTVTADKAMVIASRGMGGDGNSADVGNVSAVSPLVKVSATSNGSWDGHVTGYMSVTNAGTVTPTFSGGNVNGSHVIAAAFPGALVVPPEISTLTPANGNSTANPAGDLVATFTENIALTGNGTVTIKNLDATTQEDITLPDAQVTASDAVLTINPTNNLGFETEYAVRISSDAITDTLTPANAFAGITNDTTWSFTTSASDATPPVISNTVPANGATTVMPTANLVVTFDESIVAGSGNIVISNTTDSTVAATIDVTDSAQVTFVDAVMTIDPTSPLTAGKALAVLIDTDAVENYAGLGFAGLSDPTVWAFSVVSDTTYSGPTGNWNVDTWNNPANWDNGIPTGPLDAIIAEDEYASVSKNYSHVDTPAYTGDLTLQTNATLEIGQSSVVGDLNALGGSNIYFNTGSELRLRYSQSSVHTQNFIMQGDAKFTLGTSTSAHHDSRTLEGEISGSGKLTTHVSHNNTLYIKGNNASWSGGIYSGGTEDENKSSRIEAEAANALGTGDIMMDDGMGLRIDVADAMGDDAKLSLSGGNGSLNDKLEMNASDTVALLNVDGFDHPAGTYGRTGLGSVDYEYDWIGGNGTLTVTGAVADTTAPTVSFTDDQSGADVFPGQPVTYTVTFSEPLAADPAASDFENTADANMTVEGVTAVFETGDMTVLSYTVVVKATAQGTLNLGIRSSATLSDLFDNALVVPVADDTTLDVVPAPPIKGQLGIWTPWANGGINPETGQPWAVGDKYHVGFISSGTRDATSPDRADYDAFVQAAADAVGWDSATWYAVVACYNDPEYPNHTAARDNNVPTMTSSYAILRPDGEKLADNGADLADGPDIFYNVTETGGEYNGGVGTGGGRMMGDPGETNIERGDSTRTNGTWWRVYNGSQTSQWHIYALSDELTLESDAPTGTLILLR